MDRQKDLDRLRSDLIGKIYDVVLHPESHDDFMADWGDYIAQISEPFHERQNSADLTDVSLEDLALETHFARAHIILEKLGRPNQSAIHGVSNAGGNILLRFCRDGRVKSQSFESHERFENLTDAKDLTRFLEPESATQWQSFLDKLERSPALSSFSTFKLAEGGHLVARSMRDQESDQIEVVVSYLQIVWTDELMLLLSRRFSLSPRELELLQDLSRYGSLGVVVEKNPQSSNTIRAQMKSIFRKMNVRAQPDLMQSMALLGFLCEVIGHDDYVHMDQPIVGQLRRISHSNGPDIQVHILGPSKGKPVLFLHGILDGISVTAKIRDCLERYNVRLISLVRPNFGSAGQYHDLKRIPQRVAEQALRVMDELGISKIPVMGHVTGALYAFAVAGKLGARAEAVINIAGGVPILSTRQFAKVAPRQRVFAYTARYAPAMLPFLVRAGMVQIDAMKTEELMNDLYHELSIDRQVVRDPQIANVVADGYHFAVAQGYRGFQYDAYHFTRNWSDIVMRSSAPILLLHGAHDPAVPIQTVRDFAKREQATLIEYPKDGQLIFYSQPELLFAQMCQFLKDLRSGSQS